MFIRYMYWADSGHAPRIERARLDGSERVIIANGSIARPCGLTIDYSEGDMGHLYWCDQVTQFLKAQSCGHSTSLSVDEEYR